MAGSLWAQALPNLTTLELFEVYENTKASTPAAAMSIADDILSRTDDPELRLYFAQSALEADDPARALNIIAPVLATFVTQNAAFDQTDPRATQALDLAAEAYVRLGLREEALQLALEALYTAKARLGGENAALSQRLTALEPEVEGLRPDLLPSMQLMQRQIDEANAPQMMRMGEALIERAPDEPTAVQVWFGTNRIATGSSDPAQKFGSARGDLSLGALTVTIPPGHTAGMIERPSGWFFTQHLDPSKHVVLEGLTPLTKQVFAEGCCAADDKILFVHGYNVSFHDGALRAAQLYFDLEFSGQAMYFSWPSKATLYGYFSDANGVAETQPYLEEFFEIATRGEGKLHVIAHSMGNRYVVGALEEFFRKHPDRQLGQLVLAAPDVERAELVEQLDTLQTHSDGVTLYASKHDVALQVSNRVNGGRRAGDANGDLIRIVGLDTVDASLIEADSLGHSYFGDAPELLGDILGLIRLGWRPAERCSVSMREDNIGGEVWDVNPDGCAVQDVRTASDLVRLFGAAALDEARRRMETGERSQNDFWVGVMNLIEERFRAK